MAELVVVGSDTSRVAVISSVVWFSGPVLLINWVNSPLLINIKAGTQVLGSFKKNCPRCSRDDASPD